jgi:uncharacterized protein YndB with AHSA1/START domain
MLHFAMIVLALYPGQITPDKTVVMHSAELPISIEKAWNAFTRPEEMCQWMVARAEIDLRVGGKMLTSYNKTSDLHDERTIENTYISYDPQRMISIKCTGQPKGFPFKEAIKKMWTVIYFDPLGPDKTRVTERSLGFTDDEESQKMRAFFERGNKASMDALIAYASKKSANPEAK